jgi:fructoselysine-6-P-deglycase FrlB-like protein
MLWQEISYIHAEGYAAAEMKHGPIALIDKFMPVVVVAPQSDEHYPKLKANIQEVRAPLRVLLSGGYPFIQGQLQPFSPRRRCCWSLLPAACCLLRTCWCV